MKKSKYIDYAVLMACRSRKSKKKYANIEALINFIYLDMQAPEKVKSTLLDMEMYVSEGLMMHTD